MYSTDNFLALSSCYCSDKLCIYRLVNSFGMDAFRKDHGGYGKDHNCNTVGKQGRRNFGEFDEPSYRGRAGVIGFFSIGNCVIVYPHL